MLPSFLQLNFDIKGEAVEQQLPFVTADANGGFEAFLTRIFTGLMVIAALSVLIFLVWGAFDWINSGGEKGKIDSARNKMTGAVMGLIVLACVFVIFAFIQQVLGIQVLNLRGTPRPTSTSAPATRS